MWILTSVAHIFMVISLIYYDDREQKKPLWPRNMDFVVGYVTWSQTYSFPKPTDSKTHKKGTQFISSYDVGQYLEYEKCDHYSTYFEMIYRKIHSGVCVFGS